jgi:transposase
MQERFTIAEAAAKLNISTSGLENWINQAKLRRAVDEQRMENDMRAHYLTRPQLEQLAALHRRTLKDDDVERRFAALEQRIERLEALIANQGGISEVGS